MLVLRRGKNESVVIGDEILLTVEGFHDEMDGRELLGATVRFGFEMPRYINVCREELRFRRREGTSSGRPAPPKKSRPGELVEVSGLAVRLRIVVPRKVPVCHNGTPTIGCEPDSPENGAKTVHLVTCRNEDHITICNNISVAALGCHRFVARASTACF